MNDLGNAILNAMRDQGWMVVVVIDTVIAGDPRGDMGHAIPLELFMDEDDVRLRLVLLNLIVNGGLLWPWPPDYREDVHGEVPRTE